MNYRVICKDDASSCIAMNILYIWARLLSGNFLLNSIGGIKPRLIVTVPISLYLQKPSFINSTHLEVQWPFWNPQHTMRECSINSAEMLQIILCPRNDDFVNLRHHKIFYVPAMCFANNFCCKLKKNITHQNFLKNSSQLWTRPVVAATQNA